MPSMEYEPSAQGATISDNRLHSTMSAGKYLVCTYISAIMFHVATSIANSAPTEQVQKHSHKFMSGLTDYEFWLIYACIFDVMYWKCMVELFRQPRWADQYLVLAACTTIIAALVLANFIEGDFIKILQIYHFVIIVCASICFFIDKCIKYVTSRWPSLTFRRAPKMHV